MTLYFGADHNGFELKQRLMEFARRSHFEIIDCGDVSRDPNDDFPQYAGRTVNKLLADPDQDSRAILICGSGQGMCMAANRFKGIRASLCWNLTEARAARNDDDSNVLCLSARSIDGETAEHILNAFMMTPFAGAGRFKRRLQQLDELG